VHYWNHLTKCHEKYLVTWASVGRGAGSSPQPLAGYGDGPRDKLLAREICANGGASGLVVVPINVSHYKCDTSKVVVKFKNNAL